MRGAFCRQVENPTSMANADLPASSSSGISLNAGQFCNLGVQDATLFHLVSQVAPLRPSPANLASQVLLLLPGSVQFLSSFGLLLGQRSNLFLKGGRTLLILLSQGF